MDWIAKSLNSICNEIEELDLDSNEEKTLLEKRKLAMEKSKVSESLANIKSIIHQDSGIQDLTTKIYGEISKIISIKNEMINNLLIWLLILLLSFSFKSKLKKLFNTLSFIK